MMNQHNFPDRGDNYSHNPPHFSPDEFDVNTDLDPVWRKLTIGIFIAAVVASGIFTIYLFERSKPKVIPSSTPAAAINYRQSANVSAAKS
jgi:hypothetical protein